MSNPTKSKPQTPQRYTLDWRPFLLEGDALGRVVIPNLYSRTAPWIVCATGHPAALKFKATVEGAYGGAAYVESVLRQRAWVMDAARERQPERKTGKHNG